MWLEWVWKKYTRENAKNRCENMNRYLKHRFELFIPESMNSLPK